MSSILDLGKQYLPGALAGEPEALQALFRARVAGWGATYAHEEEMTVGLFSDLDDHIESHVAFSLLPEAVRLALGERAFDGFNCALDLTSSLVSASLTTEIPASLVSAFPELECKALAFDGEPTQYIALIRAHYRHAL